MKTFHSNFSYSFYSISVYPSFREAQKQRSAKRDLFNLAPSYSDTDHWLADEFVFSTLIGCWDYFMFMLIFYIVLFKLIKRHTSLTESHVVIIINAKTVLSLKMETAMEWRSQNKLTPNHTNSFYKIRQFPNTYFKRSCLQKGPLKDRAKF